VKSDPHPDLISDKEEDNDNESDDEGKDIDKPQKIKDVGFLSEVQEEDLEMMGTGH